MTKPIIAIVPATKIITLSILKFNMFVKMMPPEYQLGKIANVFAGFQINSLLCFLTYSGEKL